MDVLHIKLGLGVLGWILLILFMVFAIRKKKTPTTGTIYDFKEMEVPVDVYEDLPKVGKEGSLYYVEYTETYYYWKEGRYHIYSNKHPPS